MDKVLAHQVLDLCHGQFMAQLAQIIYWVTKYLLDYWFTEYSSYVVDNLLAHLVLSLPDGQFIGPPRVRFISWTI